MSDLKSCTLYDCTVVIWQVCDEPVTYMFDTPGTLNELRNLWQIFINVLMQHKQLIRKKNNFKITIFINVFTFKTKKSTLCTSLINSNL